MFWEVEFRTPLLLNVGIKILHRIIITFDCSEYYFWCIITHVFIKFLLFVSPVYVQKSNKLTFTLLHQYLVGFSSINCVLLPMPYYIYNLFIDFWDCREYFIFTIPYFITSFILNWYPLNVFWIIKMKEALTKV